MSVTQPPYPGQPSFPEIDRSQVTPTSDDVALLVATRTIDTAGDELGVFTDDTRPTDTQCDGLIQQAIEMVLTPLPNRMQAYLYPAVQQAVALQAAILVETSFYREQANTGSITALQARLGSMLSAIEEDSGASGVSNRVDSIVVRSTMADYDPYYAMPPPPVVGVPTPEPEPTVTGWDGGESYTVFTDGIDGGSADTFEGDGS